MGFTCTTCGENDIWAYESNTKGVCKGCAGEAVPVPVTVPCFTCSLPVPARPVPIGVKLRCDLCQSVVDDQLAREKGADDWEKEKKAMQAKRDWVTWWMKEHPEDKGKESEAFLASMKELDKPVPYVSANLERDHSVRIPMSKAPFGEGILRIESGTSNVFIGPQEPGLVQISDSLMKKWKGSGTKMGVHEWLEEAVDFANAAGKVPVERHSLPQTLRTCCCSCGEEFTHHYVGPCDFDPNDLECPSCDEDDGEEKEEPEPIEEPGRFPWSLTKAAEERRIDRELAEACMAGMDAEDRHDHTGPFILAVDNEIRQLDDNPVRFGSV